MESGSLTPECGPLDCAFREETSIDNDKIKLHLKSFYCSVAKLCQTFCDLLDCLSGFPVLHHSLEFAQAHVIESVIPSNYLCCPFLLLPSVFPSIRVFSNKSALRIRRPKHWSFSINPSNEYSGLISSRIDWLYLLAVQGTLKSLL